MHEVFYGAMSMQAICILMNVALVLSIAALIKYLIKGKCGLGVVAAVLVVIISQRALALRQNLAANNAWLNKH